MERDKLDFGNGKVSTLFRALFFPTLVGMVFNSVLNLCDGMFVGHGVGEDALAAINIVAPFFLLATGIGLTFGIGASVVGGVRMAEGNVKGARIILTQAFIAGLLIFGLLSLVTICFPRPLLYLLGCSEALESLAMDYLLWLLPGLLFLYLQCVGMMLIRLDGSPKYAMAVQVAGASVNIFLDWYMVFPLGWGIKGAAIATSISCFLAGSMVLIYFLFRADKLRFYRLKWSRKSLMLSLRNVGYMVKIGMATLIAEVAIGVMMVTGNFVFMKYLGEAGVAAFSVGCYLFPLIFSASNAVAQSAQPIISYNYGAKATDRVHKALRISLLTAMVCGVIISLVMWLGAPLLAAVFLPASAPAYPLAVHGLPMLGLCAVFFAVNISFISYYQSTENAARSTFYMLLRGIIFVVPGFILLPQLLGESGLWLALPAAEALTLAIIIGAFCGRGRRGGLRLKL